MPTFDAVTGSNLQSITATTFAHTVTAGGSNRALFVTICFWETAAATPATVTYGAASMTRVAQSSASSANDRVEIWRIANPLTGANNVVISRIGTNCAGRAYAQSFTDVDPTTPEGTPATNTGNDAAPTVTVAAATTDFVIDGLTSDATGAPTYTMVVDSGRTQMGNASSAAEQGCVSRDETPGTSEVMDWTITAIRTWAMAGIAVKAVSTAVTDAFFGTRAPNRQVGPTALRFGKRSTFPFDQTLAPTTADYFALRVQAPNPRVGPMALRMTRRSPVPFDTVRAPATDDHFAYPGPNPNNRVGPPVLRARYRPPTYPFDSSLSTATGNRRRRLICSGA